MKLLFPILFSTSFLQVQSEQTLDEVCEAYTDQIEHPSGGDGIYSCECTGDTEDFQAACSYSKVECMSWPEFYGYTVDFTFTENSATDDWEDCVYYRSTCNKVCYGYRDRVGMYASIDGIRCNSVKTCGADNQNEGIVIDCGNIDTLISMNSCTGEGVGGSPFEFFIASNYEASLFEEESCGLSSKIPKGLDPDNCVSLNMLTDVCEEYAGSLEHPNRFKAGYTCQCDGDSSIDFVANCSFNSEECARHHPRHPSSL